MVTIVLAVLVLGILAYTFGNQIIPAIGDAGVSVKSQVEKAFQ